jgi:hypothetical protein
MKAKMYNAYYQVNTAFIVLLVAGFMLLYMSKLHYFKIPACYYKAKYGVECKTCGLTRDFYKIMSFNNIKSLHNPFSLRYFSFLAYALLSRIVILLLFLKAPMYKEIVVADCILSSVLFILLML